jgi:hypothetical protein
VALALIVENAGLGSAPPPRSRGVFDYVLAGQYPSEEDIAQTQKGPDHGAPSAPRRAPTALPGQPAAGGGVAFPPPRHRRAGRRRHGPRLRSLPMTVISNPRCCSACALVHGFDLPLLLAVLWCAPGAWSACTRPATTTAPASWTTAQHAAGLGMMFVVAQVPPQR